VETPKNNSKAIDKNAIANKFLEDFEPTARPDWKLLAELALKYAAEVAEAASSTRTQPTDKRSVAPSNRATVSAPKKVQSHSRLLLLYSRKFRAERGIRGRGDEQR